MNLLVTLSAALCLWSGCLAESYTIPDQELARLAQTAPETRGQKVRVVQQLSWEDSPPPAPHRHHAQCGHYHSDVVLAVYGHYPRRTHQRRDFTGSSINISPQAGGGGASGGGGGKGGGGSAGSGGGSVNTGSISDGKALAVAAVVAAAFFTVFIVATEGKRYDGWVSVEPDHPIHLVYRDGRQQVLPLSNLTPQDARKAHHALVVGETLYDMDFIGRAPLSRRGWTWKMEGGAMSLAPPIDDATTLQPGALMELGYFPDQNLGVVGFLALAGGTHRGADVLGVRTGFGLHLMPLQLGRVHLGAYGLFGSSFDGIEGDQQSLAFRRDFTVGGGALIEVDLSTRLALSARAGVHIIGPTSALPINTSLLTLGLATY